MRTAIVYYSAHHGNTRKLAEAVAQGREVTLIDALAVKSAGLSGYDLIGFASGIYFGKFHQSVVEFAKNNLPRDKKVFFYSERIRTLYAASFGSVVDYVGQLEPWEDIDAYLFNGTMDWVVAVTHEDVILCLGI